MSNEGTLNHGTGINAVLITENRMFSLWLPNPPKGRLFFENGVNEKVTNSFCFDGTGENWIIHSLTSLKLTGLDGEAFTERYVNDQFIAAYKSENGQSYLIYCEQADSESVAFHNYRVIGDNSIHIGRAYDNDIVYRGALMSRYDAVLTMHNQKFKIQDSNSSNGIFVNGKKYAEKDLQLGDSIYIMGLRIVIGCGFISVNDESRLSSIHVGRIIPVRTTSDISNIYKSIGKTYKFEDHFNRYPRKMVSMKVNDVIIEGPPVGMNGNHIPLLLQIGSPIAMGAASALSGFFNPFSMASSLMYPLMTAGYSEKQRKEYEERRVAYYSAYLNDKEKEINQEIEAEETALRTNYPPLSKVIHYSLDNRHKLWERKSTDKDFLQLRIGTGRLPLKANIEFPKQRFHLDKDEMEEKMFELGRKKFFLDDVPIVIDFKQNYVVGVNGSENMILYFVKALATRISELYSYDEVKMVLLCRQDQLMHLSFMKYLPHLFDSHRSVRFLAVDDADTITLTEYLRNEIGEDLNQEDKFEVIMQRRPYYIIFSLDQQLYDSMEIVKQAVKKSVNIGVSLISCYENIPKETSLLINLHDTGVNSVTYLKEPEKKESAFVIDGLTDQETFDKSIWMLDNTILRTEAEGYSLPKSLPFLKIYNVGRVEHLNILKRWRESNSVNTLGAPIGIDSDGHLFSLDLHQKRQGPHGLVAGMTGSGKSEFLITYILSMAVNYSPDDVSFLLIDYKGGGLAGAFDDPARGIHLPHLIGTITNLDGPAMLRSFIAINSELMRRQRLFNKARSISGESTMDIYTYQRLYHGGQVKEPLPHLIIISDEFAELKQQQPDVMDQLISIARIGRSLGVHLILATQKPSGIVNDQIRSNTKFQVCMKVQDRSDSMDMLDRPDAAELKDTGRFYIQVGYHEYYALGQAAWSGCKYYPQDEVTENIDNSIDVIDNSGQTVYSAKPKTIAVKPEGTQLTAIVKYISDLAKEEGLIPKQLWKDPLKKTYDLKDIVQSDTREKININIGMIDDPENLSQAVFSVDFLKNSQLIAGEQGSGKTSLVFTMLMTLSEQFTPDEVNFYILDFNSHMLKQFDKLPHCGTVLDENTAGYFSSFLKMMDDIVARRKALFDENQVNSFEMARHQINIPLILIVIDDFEGIKQNAELKDFYYNLQEYIRNYSQYGIRFILTCSHSEDLPGRIRKELGNVIALHQADAYEYGNVLEGKTGYVPPNLPGRGMINQGGRLLEMQTALFEANQDSKIRLQDASKKIQKIAEKYNDFKGADRLKMIDLDEDYSHFQKQFSNKRIPLGYYLQNASAIALPYVQLTRMLLYFGNAEGIKPVISNFFSAFAKDNVTIYIVPKEKNSIFESNSLEISKTFENITVFDNKNDEFDKIITKAVDHINEINSVYKSYCQENNYDYSEWFHMDNQEFIYTIRQIQDRKVKDTRKPLIIFVESFRELCQKLQTDTDLAEKYSALLSIADRFEIKFVACTYPFDYKHLTGSTFATAYMNGMICLLNGGNYGKQDFVSVPDKYMANDQELPYNQCLLSYREDLYPLMMPCGILKEKVGNRDELSLF